MGTVSRGHAWTQRNVLGGELEPCGTDPVTGFLRDGSCHTLPDGTGVHTVCTVVTEEFLEHQVSVGNDLVTPRPEWGFAGLVPGDRWCVVAHRWKQAFEDGYAAPVVLAATNEAASGGPARVAHRARRRRPRRRLLSRWRSRRQLCDRTPKLSTPTQARRPRRCHAGGMNKTARVPLVVDALVSAGLVDLTRRDEAAGVVARTLEEPSAAPASSRSLLVEIAGLRRRRAGGRLRRALPGPAVGGLLRDRPGGGARLASRCCSPLPGWWSRRWLAVTPRWWPAVTRYAAGCPRHC